jgi:hypothetical protein
MMIIIYLNCNQLTSKFQFDPHQLWDAFTFVCEGIDFACPSVLACDIDVNYNLITAIAKYGEYAALN